MPFHGLYHRIHSCYQGSNHFQAQKFHSNDHRDRIWPFLAIFDRFWSSAFWGRRPMHFRSNHDLNLWFSTVTLLWLIMRLLLSGIIERRLSRKKLWGDSNIFFDKLLNWRIIWTKDIWETMVESVDICSEAGGPTFWLISIFFVLGILKNYLAFLIIFDQNTVHFRIRNSGQGYVL